ncbi:hypothetical protein FGO68_gene21 [Halteria grandinella]|uniref:Uncharacterized protein n=1 Tax=Halteria grandinella TaxID=5974 RepID=A0A8J8P4I7_HALGN|nr:hypothetical protein FGO68_gene21 [Halteria grandinella]
MIICMQVGLQSASLFALAVNLLKVIIMISIELVRRLRRRCCSSRDRVIILRRRVKKYAPTMPTVQEENIEEEKEDPFNLQQRKKPLYNQVNETSMPSASLSHSMIAQDVTIQDWT